MSSSLLRKNEEFGYQHNRKDDSWVKTLTIFSLAIGLLGLFAWAYSFDLKEITRGQGQVIPMSKAQIVQSLDAGILTDLKVKQHDTLKAGQSMLSVDDARTGPE